MQAGDLADGPLVDILRTLAAASATGGLHVHRREEGESAGETAADAVLYLREGRLYAATAPGPRPLLGVRLVSAGAVTREALEEALESQAGQLVGWRLGELLVHLGYVDADIVAEFVEEQILDTIAEVSSWPAGGWRFRRGEKTREADGLSLDIDDVVSRVHERRLSWRDLEAWAGGAHAVPLRISFDEELAADQIPLARTLLDEVDGRRTLAELATRCGLTTYEAGYVLSQLVESGAVSLQGAAEPPVDAPNPAVADAADDDDLSSLLGDEEVDLATQLAVLARQAEEARWNAETRQHQELAARRAAAAAAQDPDAPATDPIPLERPVIAMTPPLGVVPSPADDEPTAWDEGDDPLGVDGVLAEPLQLEPLPAWPGLSPVDEATEPSDDDGGDPAADALLPPPPPALPPHRTPASSIGDPTEFVPTIPPADDRAAIHAALAEVAAGSFASAAEVEPATAAATDWPADVATSNDYAPDLAEQAPMADTASLLRELSFLGLEDVPAPAAAPARPLSPRAAPAAAPGKTKRKSIFGR